MHYVMIIDSNTYGICDFPTDSSRPVITWPQGFQVERHRPLVKYVSLYVRFFCLTLLATSTSFGFVISDDSSVPCFIFCNGRLTRQSISPWCVLGIFPSSISRHSCSWPITNQAFLVKSSSYVSKIPLSLCLPLLRIMHVARFMWGCDEVSKINAEMVHSVSRTFVDAIGSAFFRWDVGLRKSITYTY